MVSWCMSVWNANVVFGARTTELGSVLDLIACSLSCPQFNIQINLTVSFRPVRPCEGTSISLLVLTTYRVGERPAHVHRGRPGGKGNL